MVCESKHDLVDIYSFVCEIVCICMIKCFILWLTLLLVWLLCMWFFSFAMIINLLM